MCNQKRRIKGQKGTKFINYLNKYVSENKINHSIREMLFQKVDIPESIDVGFVEALIKCFCFLKLAMLFRHFNIRCPGIIVNFLVPSRFDS